MAEDSPRIMEDDRDDVEALKEQQQLVSPSQQRYSSSTSPGVFDPTHPLPIDMGIQSINQKSRCK
jgi:hypothetical protein